MQEAFLEKAYRARQASADALEDAADDAAADLDVALASHLINFPDARSPGK